MKRRLGLVPPFLTLGDSDTYTDPNLPRLTFSELISPIDDHARLELPHKNSLQSSL